MSEAPMMTREQVLGNQGYIERHLSYLSSPDVSMLQAIVDTDAALRAKVEELLREVSSLESRVNAPPIADPRDQKLLDLEQQIDALTADLARVTRERDERNKHLNMIADLLEGKYIPHIAFEVHPHAHNLRMLLSTHRSELAAMADERDRAITKQTSKEKWEAVNFLEAQLADRDATIAELEAELRVTVEQRDFLNITCVKDEATIARLREALEMLYDTQNGVPLYKYEKDWKEAMAKAQAALKEGA